MHPKIIKSIFALLIFTGSTSALTNYINVAGELRDGSGNLLNGNYDIIFKIYNASSGGTLLWNESYTGNNSVTVENGYFSVALGSNNTLNLSFDENYYLSVEIGTQGQLSSQLQSGKSTADYELPERYALGTAGYSFNSRQAGRFMCPTNMIYAGIGPFGSGGFCIDRSLSSENEWWNHTLSCYQQGKRVCEIAEWWYALHYVYGINNKCPAKLVLGDGDVFGLSTTESYPYCHLDYVSLQARDTIANTLCCI